VERVRYESCQRISFRAVKMETPAFLAPILQTAGADVPDPRGADATTGRILAAALAEFERSGIRRTTMESVARGAGVTRITIYRRFPQKERLVEAVIVGEAQRFFAELEAAVAGLDSVEDRIVEAFVHTLAATREQRLLNRLLATEPELLLPHLTTEGGPVLAAGTEFLARQMRIARSGVPARETRAVAELVARLVLSFLLTPQSAVALGNSREARRFARRYVAPLMTGRSPGAA
jgi:AcrR family transcriptional regulator